MSRTGYVHAARCLLHEPGAGHPERPERLRAVDARLRQTGLADELDAIEASEATEALLERLHPAEHVRRGREACDRAPAALDGDTRVSAGSFGAALLAAGGVVEACRRVVRGDWHNAFCALRPPGHHAEAARAMGFCLFNNVALAAAELLEGGPGEGVGGEGRRLERVAILDWDVHHGNGTQHLFEADPRVFYASLHQWPLYPGTGAAEERGVGEGEGTTLNRPMAPGSGDGDWMRELEGSVLPELETFRPDLVLVSAGFDAHRLDPLAGCRVTEEGFRRMTQAVLELARRTAGGRLVSVLEGGYHLDALAASVEAHVEELLADGRAGGDA